MARTKVIMKKHSFQAFLRWLPTITALALLSPTMLAGQQARVTAASNPGPSRSQAVEIASLGPLPSAPEVGESAPAAGNGSEAYAIPAIQVVSFP